MKPLYKAIIVMVAAIVLVAALGSAFNQIATSPILTRDLNSQDENQDIPIPAIPDINLTDPRRSNDLPDMNSTVLPPELNYTIPDMPGNISGDGTTIGGTVFNDADGDGLVDPGEALPNVGVQLFDQNGTLIGTTQTNATGEYSFTGVDPGRYNISAFPGMNGNITGSENRTITVDGTPQDGIDIGTAPGPAGNPAINTITDITSPRDQFLIRKGVMFPVSGTVTTGSLQPISGVRVAVFVATSKTTMDRHFIGIGQVDRGFFTVNCLIPDDLQLGNYQLIARFLGDGTYRPSESDPAVKIMDDTKLTIEAPDRVVMGVSYDYRFTLVENASSKAVQYAPLYIGELSQYLQTDSQGVAHFNIRWTTPGFYSFKVTYGGNATLYGTSANKSTTVLEVSVDVAPSYLVRGYDNRLFVLVHASELPVTLRTVQVYLETYEVGTFLTDGEGRVNVTVPVAYDRALGPARMAFDIANIKRCEVSLDIRSTTTMVVKLEGNQVNATLLDDHDQVMLSMPILLQRTDRTNVDVGVSMVGSEFSLENRKETDYVVNFTGSSIYQPSSATVHYSPPGFGSAMDWLIIGAIGTVAVIALAALAMSRGKRTVPTDLGLLPSTPAPVTGQTTSPYGLSFPDIADDLPLVWEENRSMLFRVSGQGSMHLDIDGNGSDVDLPTGSGDFTVTLPKGDHILSVSGHLGKTTVPFRVVNYREETVSIYRTSYARWRSRDEGISDSMTCREIQTVLEGRMDRSQHGQLDVAISLFEIAEFSERPVGRPEYESMYRASRQVS